MNNSFPTLSTERLLLRQLLTTDEKAIFNIRSNEVVYKYIAKSTFKKTKEAQAFIERINKDIAHKQLLLWAITLNDTQELIGTICLWNFSKDKLVAEVGYELYPDYYKQGIMTEALTKIIDFGFNTLKLEVIEAFTHKANEASKILLKRHNFKLDPNRTDKGFPNNIIFVLKNSLL
jgi:ribosomal-protein-alanine N-acetyltransferase